MYTNIGRLKITDRNTHTTKTINVVPNLSNTVLSSYHTNSVIIFWCHLLATRKEQTQQHDKRFELFLFSLFLFVKWEYGNRSEIDSVKKRSVTRNFMGHEITANTS